MAARLRAHGADMHLEAVAGGGRLAVVADGTGKKMVLDVGVLDAGLGADEGAGFEMVGGAEARAQEQPLGSDQALPEQIELGIERDRLRAADLEIDLQMVLQVLADAGQMMHRSDAGRTQALLVADARQLQQLGRVEGRRGKDHLARRPDGVHPAEPAVLDAHRALAFEHDAPASARDQRDVAALASRGADRLWRPTSGCRCAPSSPSRRSLPAGGRCSRR
jgi:hypothetical protein